MKQELSGPLLRDIARCLKEIEEIRNGRREPNNGRTEPVRHDVTNQSPRKPHEPIVVKDSVS